jgi:hypothetical protein
MQFSDFLDTLRSKTGKAAQKSGSGYSTCCPAHDDKNPSLSISEGSDGKILLKCFAGCSTEAICSSLGLTVSDLFNTSPAHHQNPINIIYSYKDETGRELYRKIRMEPGVGGRDKGFFCERTGDTHKGIFNMFSRKCAAFS